MWKILFLFQIILTSLSFFFECWVIFNLYFSLSEEDIIEDEQLQKFGIYVKSSKLMQQLVRSPHEAKALLQVSFIHKNKL